MKDFRMSLSSKKRKFSIIVDKNHTTSLKIGSMVFDYVDYIVNLEV
ncbi:hypothetical protein [Clostridioides sp. ZZV15-6598]|nr:hypothetical protein [Clostridioides sp. ZZV15-6598]